MKWVFKQINLLATTTSKEYTHISVDCSNGVGFKQERKKERKHQYVDWENRHWLVSVHYYWLWEPYARIKLLAYYHFYICAFFFGKMKMHRR